MEETSWLVALEHIVMYADATHSILALLLDTSIVTLINRHQPLACKTPDYDGVSSDFLDLEINGGQSCE